MSIFHYHFFNMRESIDSGSLFFPRPCGHAIFMHVSRSLVWTAYFYKSLLQIPHSNSLYSHYIKTFYSSTIQVQIQLVESLIPNFDSRENDNSVWELLFLRKLWSPSITKNSRSKAPRYTLHQTRITQKIIYLTKDIHKVENCSRLRNEKKINSRNSRGIRSTKHESPKKNYTWLKISTR